MGINTNTSWSDIAKERARLPVRFKGLGLREAKERRYSQFIGGAAQSLIPLLNRQDKHNNTIVGRMHIPCIVNLLGEDSFDFPLTSPWENMLNNKRPTHNIANGVQQTWSHLQLKFRGVATPNACDDDDLLVNQPVQRAGFRSNGTIPSSVTRDITMEIESAISTYLGKHIINTLTRKDYERWSWEGWTNIGASFVTSPPDGIGFIKDCEFRSIVATYLGQPDPNLASLVGRYFGKKGKQLDDHGANLASESLPGGGFRRIHNNIQSLIQSMMKVAGIPSVKEAVNFLLGKVGEPHIKNYVDHLASEAGRRNSLHSIVPDITATGYPAGKQTVNDSGASQSGEIFCEIKTQQPNNTRYNHDNSKLRPTDRRAKGIVKEYDLKFKKLDRVYAPDVVGDGSNGVVGPFEAAQQLFIGGQVVPLVVGAFGDVNKDLEKMLRTLAKCAAAGEDGMSISPLRNLDKKGGAFAIMHSQFRRALGVTIVRDMANHKLSRLHYVRATAEDAKNTAEANHSDNRGWNYGSGTRSGWYSKHTPGGYANYEQFRNGNFFGTL
jgi:hypothetical protein